jgi:hypothetical protein
VRARRKHTWLARAKDRWPLPPHGSRLRHRCLADRMFAGEMTLLAMEWGGVRRPSRRGLRRKSAWDAWVCLLAGGGRKDSFLGRATSDNCGVAGSAPGRWPVAPAQLRVSRALQSRPRATAKFGNAMNVIRHRLLELRIRVAMTPRGRFIGFRLDATIT